MPSVPEYLADLARRAQQAVDAVEAAGAETREALVSRVERTRTDAERMADSLHAGAIAAEREAVSRWSRIQADWKDHVLSMRSHIRDHRAGRDVAGLAERAEYAERYAQAAVDLAAAAVRHAEYAVLDAALARSDLALESQAAGR